MKYRHIYSLVNLCLYSISINFDGNGIVIVFGKTHKAEGIIYMPQKGKHFVGRWNKFEKEGR